MSLFLLGCCYTLFLSNSFSQHFVSLASSRSHEYFQKPRLLFGLWDNWFLLGSGYLFFSLIRFQRQRLIFKSLFCCVFLNLFFYYEFELNKFELNNKGRNWGAKRLRTRLHSGKQQQNLANKFFRKEQNNRHQKFKFTASKASAWVNFIHQFDMNEGVFIHHPRPTKKKNHCQFQTLYPISMRDVAPCQYWSWCRSFLPLRLYSHVLWRSDQWVKFFGL